MISKNSELVLYNKGSNNLCRHMKMHRAGDKLIFESKHDGTYVKMIYDIRRLSVIPKAGDSKSVVDLMVIRDTIDDYILVNNNPPEDTYSMYVLAERDITIFADDGRRIGEINIHLMKTSDARFFEYSKQYYYDTEVPSLKSVIEKEAVNKYNLHIKYRNNKIDTITRKKVVI